MSYDPRISHSFCLSIYLSIYLSLTHSYTSKHIQTNNPLLFVSSYCFFWSTVKTGNHRGGKRRNTKQRSDTRDRKGQAHSCGSVLQFLITVIGDWLSLLHSEEWPRRQTSKLNTSLDTTLSADSFTQSNQCYIIISISATSLSSRDIVWWRWDGL